MNHKDLKAEKGFHPGPWLECLCQGVWKKLHNAGEVMTRPKLKLLVCFGHTLPKTKSKSTSKRLVVGKWMSFCDGAMLVLGSVGVLNGCLWVEKNHYARVTASRVSLAWCRWQRLKSGEFYSQSQVLSEMIEVFKKITNIMIIIMVKTIINDIW